MVKEDKVQVTLLVDSRKAVNELGKLELEAREAKEAMKGLKRNSDEFNAASAKFKEATAKVEALRKELGLAGMSMQQLKNYQAQLNREIGREIKGSEKWNELKGRIQQVSKALSDQRNELAGTNTLWSKIGAEAKAFGMVALTYLGLQELVGQIGNMVRGLADLSDAMADVSKTTGLTAAEVEGLSEQLKKIDTRTSRKQLLDLASIAGKLGVSGSKDVLEFVKAADKINVALGSDFGGNAEETIKQVGKLVDIFKLKQEFGLEQGLIKVGSVINSLGAASTAAEGYLVDFTKRMGGIAPSAKISAPDIIALAATMDQLGQSSETSSTALAQLLVAFAQDVPSFAKLAGKSISDFSDMLENDANGALIAVLEGAQSTKAGLAGMASTLTKLGIDGARSASVVGVLSNNIKLLKDQQTLAKKEFEAGTSIMKEFEVKNNNLAASVEKLQKRIAGAFINSGFMNALQNMIGGLEKATRQAKDHSNGLRDEEKSLMALNSRMNAQMSLLRDGNMKQDERAKLIAEINRQYKDYLPFLLTEKSGIEEVAMVQERANESLRRSILMKSKQADFAEKTSRLNDLELQQEADMMRLIEAQTKAREALEKSGSARSMKVPTGFSGGYVDQETAFGRAQRTAEEIERQIESRKNSIKLLELEIKEQEKLYGGMMKRLGFEEKANETAEQTIKRLEAENAAERERLGLMQKQASIASSTAKFHEEKAEADEAWRAVAALQKEIELRQQKIDALRKEAKSKAAAPDRTAGAQGGSTAKAEQKTPDFDALFLKWQEFQQKVKGVSDESWLATQSAEQREFEAINSKYEKLLNEANTFRDAMVVGDAEYNAMIASITDMHGKEITAKAKEINDRLVAENKEKNEKRLKDDMEFWASEAEARAKADRELEENRQKELQAQVQYYSQLGSLLSEFSTLMTATNSLIAAMGEEQGEFQKQLALFNVGIEMAASIAKATSAAMSAGLGTGVAAPFTTPIFIAQLTGIVVSSFAKAYSLLNSEAPQAPSFFHGGFSGDGPAVGYDRYGKIVGGVHTNEYIVPESLLFGNPWVANQVAIIDAMRVGRISDPPQMPGQATGTSDNTAMYAMLERFDRMEARLERAILSLDKPAQAYFSRDEAEAMQKYFAQNDDNRKKSTL